MLLFIMFFLGGVHGHMGVSEVCNAGKQTCINSVAGKPSRDERVVNDAYRYPNGGHCHGIAPQDADTTFAVGDTVTLTMSSGAAHNGGHCALFLARKSDNEEKWFKQMDSIDCTTSGSMAWKIEAALVPEECNTVGCSLIWVWMPTSSGACEIYMNCFDIKIEGSNGGADPKATTITKNPACERVNAEKKTKSFGDFCGTECNEGGGTVVTQPPTSSATTLAPTTTPSNVPEGRCGNTWVDANNQCLAKCTAATEGANCNGLKCFADMIRLCETTPTAGPSLVTQCRAVGVWSGNAGIHKWCATNCPETCPASHCECSNKRAYVEESTNTYNPVCQKKEIQSKGITILNITIEFDLSAYVTNLNIGSATSIDAATQEAADELLKFNLGCDAVSVASVDEPIAVGKTVFITGDCQLTNECLQPSSAHHQHNGFSNLFIAMLAMCLSFAF